MRARDAPARVASCDTCVPAWHAGAWRVPCPRGACRARVARAVPACGACCAACVGGAVGTADARCAAARGAARWAAALRLPLSGPLHSLGGGQDPPRPVPIGLLLLCTRHETLRHVFEGARCV
jgi:hypothetical protein